MSFFDSYVYDIKFKQSLITGQQASPAKNFLIKNYHLMGFVKKFVIVLTLYYTRAEKIHYLLYLYYVLFGLQLILSIFVQPFVWKSINYLRQFGDLLVIG